MTTEQTAQQLELAAQILRSGHPWEIRSLVKEEWRQKNSSESNPVNYIAWGHKIRLALATPPDNRPIHNPDSLTAEQVGVGYRLLCAEDGVPSGKVDTWMFGGWRSSYDVDKKHLHKCDKTYRIPLSIPWPEPKPDPYAELKKAHAEGKVIQARPQNYWVDSPNPSWNYPVEAYRVKPEAPPFQLPPPPPGMQWHRTDGWKEGDLPQGMRPLVYGETRLVGDEFFPTEGCDTWRNKWQTAEEGFRAQPQNSVNESSYKSRTRRPLTFTHEGKTWTWHRPGDPMPCDENREVFLLFSDNLPSRTSSKASRWEWDDQGPRSTIIGWRYADEKKPIDETIQELSDNEILQLRKLLSYFAPLITQTKNG